VTLKETIQDILVDHFGVSYAGSKITADAILAAIHNHLTTPEALKRAESAFRAALLAALESEG